MCGGSRQHMTVKRKKGQHGESDGAVWHDFLSEKSLKWLTVC